ncbi:LysR family transcriptional regulator [Edaphobacter sp. 12200R-103]|jgi:LysR family hydrogen peroxide-inducible transcriptional activator|uniref:LysR family transcriptional regulator n=1 Tax=Edaphobacter sp. 12200R-103 TaxID=2703788 RepID=UPI00138C2486|nr:LysR family transcriptional regulator [Edaphobacter sp. 12200R-103]QHS52679.1 LysR family transcriptional regulator [Edaphobacter sp. 12200R-103]
MEFHQLRYVCAVAETGSFSRAAERCQIAQPSLSQQVLKLEENLGAKLFDRLGRSVRLTEAGRAFIPHARSILEQMETARSSVAQKNADVRGSVSLGVIPTISPYLVPRYTTSFAKRFPDAKLRIVEDVTPVLIESLRELSIDIAILALPLRHKDLELFPLRTEPLFAVLPKEHRLAGAASLSLRDLRGEPFVMLRDGHCFRDLSLATCARARITPNIAFESGQFSSLFGMVAAGVGISLAPEMAVDRNAGCRYIRLSDVRATRTVVAAVLRGRSFNRVQRAFLSGMQK